MHRRVAAALVAVLALGIASCGSSETLTSAELSAKIEAACRQGQQKTRQQMGSTRGSTPAGAGPFLAAVIAGQRVVLDRLAELEPPDAAKDDFAGFRQEMRQRVDLFAGVAGKSRAEVQRSISAAQAEGEALSRRLQATAARLRVRGCI